MILHDPSVVSVCITERHAMKRPATGWELKLVAAVNNSEAYR